MIEAMTILAGILGLWIGTEIAVRTGGEIGRRLGLSEMVLGLTVFAIGTDISELAVSIEASIARLEGGDTSGLVVGNALGSVLAQGGLVLGVLAFAHALDFSDHDENGGPDRNAIRNAFAWLVATFGLWAVAGDGVVSRLEGAALVLAYAVYLGAMLRTRVPSESGDEVAPARAFDLLRLALGLVFGLALVVGSADLVVEHTIGLATRTGIPPTAIGLFGVGLGTSLPELAVSVGAIARGRPALSVGNVIGSNVFDLMIPIGVAGAISPLEIGRGALLFDLPMVTLFAGFFAFRLAAAKAFGVRDAILLLVFYFGFVLFRLGTFAG